MATAADIVSSVRTVTNQPVTGAVADADILLLANEEYPLVRRMIAQIAPDLFATESGDLTIASGASELDVSSLTNLDLIFEVKRLCGTQYLPFGEAGDAPQMSTELLWRRRGMSGAGAVLEIYPTTKAPGTYRVRYMATAAALITTGPGSPNAVLLPPGGERVLVESVAARVRDLMERDYTLNFQARDKVLAELRHQLLRRGYVAKGRLNRLSWTWW